jgi:hypothetical protein
LVIAECVLIYMDPIDGDRLLERFANHFPLVMCLIYEQIEPHDKFGLMMMMNLQVISFMKSYVSDFIGGNEFRVRRMNEKIGFLFRNEVFV